MGGELGWAVGGGCALSVYEERVGRTPACPQLSASSSSSMAAGWRVKVQSLLKRVQSLHGS